MNELTQEEKQAIFAKGWLVDMASRMVNGEQYKMDMSIIAYAQEKGMVLPPELAGWTPIDQIPDEWKDGREVLLLPYGKFVYNRILIWDKDSELWKCPHSKYAWDDHAFTHATLPLPTPPKDGGLER